MIWTEMHLQKISKDNYKLLNDVQVSHDNSVINIPAGYCTNGADIPRIFWQLFPPYSPEYIEPVIIHDFLCEVAHIDNDFRYADYMFKEALIASGVSKIKANTFYLAVRSYHKLVETFKGETNE